MGYFCISKQCGTIAAAHNSCIPSILVGNLVMWTGCSRSVHAVTLSTVVVVLERTLIHLKGIELVCANCSAGQTKTQGTATDACADPSHSYIANTIRQ